MQYAIETFSLTKIFSDWWGRDKVYAVDELNLQVQYNEVFGLLGPNGSGKTTTLKMLLGLLYPSSGRAIVLGGDSSDPKINARIGFLPEESYLYRYLNARETLEFYGRLFGLPPKVRKMRIEALLDMVGLKAAANRPVGTYSKGMARRIGLAQALINDPDLLILDEPTTGLDPIGTRQIKDLIVQLAKRGKTVLLCSHLLADVEDVCDRIAILYDGKIQAKGKVRELLQQTHKKQFTTGAISNPTIEKIKQLVEAEDAECVVTSPMDKLETFFIRTVMAAQRQFQPSSGAVSTGRIGDFLSAEHIEESILDKLVSATQMADKSAPVSPPSTPAITETEKVMTADSPRGEADGELLERLMEEGAEPIRTEPVTEAESSEPGNDRRQDEKNILDQLTSAKNKDQKKDNQRAEDGGQNSRPPIPDIQKQKDINNA